MRQKERYEEGKELSVRKVKTRKEKTRNVAEDGQSRKLMASLQSF